MGHHEAQEGRHRLAPCEVVGEAHQEHRGRREARRARPAGQPDAVRRRPEGEEDLGPQGQHRPRRQAPRRNRPPTPPHTPPHNKTRAAAEVRTALPRNGGTLADPGSVAYNFGRKGVIVVGEGTSEDDIMLAVLEAGAEEVEPHGDGFAVITEATDLVPVRSALQDAGIEYESAD